MKLSDYELAITKELINLALTHAAAAFSKMTNEHVLVDQLQVACMHPTQFEQLVAESPEETLIILTTEVKGNLEGKSYLIFNLRDTEQITRLVASGHKMAESGEMSELQRALLLELDNILSAAVITQLSNFLDVFTYGDVPDIQKLTQAETLAGLKKEADNFNVLFQIHAQFKSDKTNICPSFIWFFKAGFLQSIKQLMQNQKQLTLLKSSLAKV